MYNDAIAPRDNDSPVSRTRLYIIYTQAKIYSRLLSASRHILAKIQVTDVKFEDRYIYKRFARSSFFKRVKSPINKPNFLPAPSRYYSRSKVKAHQ